MHHMILRIPGGRAAFGLLMLFLFGCAGSARQTVRTAAETSATHGTPVASPGTETSALEVPAVRTSRDEMFAALTKRPWCIAYRISEASQETAELSRLTLSADGMYREVSSFSDAVPPPQPLRPWNFTETGADTGVLYLGDSRYVAQRMVMFDLLPTGALRLYGLHSEGLAPPALDYRHCATPPATVVPEHRAASLPTIALDPFYRSLGGTTWVLASEMAPPSRPVELEFLADGRVRETFTATECADPNRYVRGRQVEPSADGRCRIEEPYRPERHRRTGKFVERSSQPYVLQGELGRERYFFLPVKYATAYDREIARHVDAVLAYEPPIRRTSLPATIVVWNAGSGSEYVENVSLTQHLVHLRDRPEKPVAEISLAAELAPGQSVTKTFNLTVASLETSVLLYFYFRLRDGAATPVVRHY